MAHKRGKKEEISPFYVVLKWLVDLSVAVGAALFIGVFLGEQITMTGYSMEPALTNEDELLIACYIILKSQSAAILLYFCRGLTHRNTT